MKTCIIPGCGKEIKDEYGIKCHYDLKTKIAWIINENGCWEIISHKPQSNGYVMLTLNTFRQSAHRYYYEFFNKKIGKNLLIRHTCDNKLCINPNHLLEGTHKENYEDAASRNRNTKCEKVWTHKITSKEVKEILGDERERKIIVKEYSKKYNLSKSQIRNILNGRCWRSVL